MEWSDENVLQLNLNQLIEKYEYFYNLKSIRYRNRSKKRAVMKSIADSLSTTAFVSRHYKISKGSESIQSTTYPRVYIFSVIQFTFDDITQKMMFPKSGNICALNMEERRKTTHQKSGMSTDDSYESKWKYFKLLSFLDNSIITKKTSSSVEMSFSIDDTQDENRLINDGDGSDVEIPSSSKNKRVKLLDQGQRMENILKKYFKVRVDNMKVKEIDENVSFGSMVTAELKVIKKIIS